MAAAAVAIGSILSGVASVVVSIAATVASVITSALAPVLSFISTIGVSAVFSVGAYIANIAKIVTSTTGPFIKALTGGIYKIGTTITSATAPILRPIQDGLTIVYQKVKAVDTFVANMLAPVKQVTDTINSVATLKVLYDFVRGQATISQMLDKVAAGKSFETAASIAETTKLIISTGVGIMDRVDTQVSLLKTSIDTFDEKIKMSVKEFKSYCDARLVAAITPLSKQQGVFTDKINRQIASLYRHVEDVSWFEVMMIKVMT